jgi:hypothetical protein
MVALGLAVHLLLPFLFASFSLPMAAILCEQGAQFRGTGFLPTEKPQGKESGPQVEETEARRLLIGPG